MVNMPDGISFDLNKITTSHLSYWKMMIRSTQNSMNTYFYLKNTKTGMIAGKILLDIPFKIDVYDERDAMYVDEKTFEQSHNTAIDIKVSKRLRELSSKNKLTFTYLCSSKTDRMNIEKEIIIYNKIQSLYNNSDVLDFYKNEIKDLNNQLQNRDWSSVDIQYLLKKITELQNEETTKAKLNIKNREKRLEKSKIHSADIIDLVKIIEEMKILERAA